MADKKYGLILSDKGKPTPPKFQAARNVFGNDSDSEEESRKPILLRPSDIIKRQAKTTQEKALSEDPTVYQYDEIYDEMTDNKEKERSKTKEEKKPRYIENLLKTATKRKIENERRMERQIQKEREEEGEEFKDKEIFVTSAYKKKLEELRQEEEKEKREEYLEKIGDVTKQRDLGGFYRHLYEQKLGTGISTENTEQTPVIDSEETSQNRDIPSTKYTEQTPVIDAEETSQNKDIPKPVEDSLKKRNYRKRKLFEAKLDLSEGELEDSDGEVNRINLEVIKSSKKNKADDDNIDADSDFSIDDSSDEESKKKDNERKDGKCKLVPDQSTMETSLTPEKKPIMECIKQENGTLKKEMKVVEEKPKIDIWKKRTVGEIFDQAQKRYYERKSARGS